MAKKWCLPIRYNFAEEVPKDGASCATCIFRRGEESCLNKFYVRAKIVNQKTGEVVKKAGETKLGAVANRWCCGAWSHEKRKD